MARGKNSRRRASVDSPGPATLRKNQQFAASVAQVQQLPVAADSASARQEILDAIEFHWKNLSLELKQFLLENPHQLSLRKFVDFWTSPLRCENTNPNIAASICGCSWYLALNYMNIGKIVEARALILNGCFLQQCYNKPIEEIAAVADTVSGDSFREHLPYYTDGLLAISSKERIAAFLRNKVSADYQRRMSFATQTTQTKKKVRDYVDQISSDWSGNGGGSGAASRRQRDDYARRRRASLGGGPPADGAACVEIRLVDDRTKEETAVRHGVDMTMKSLFKKYAEDRGASLRQLRFSYGGRTLFLSSVGQKTPQDLGISHLDSIVVTDSSTAASPKPGAASPSDALSGDSSDESKRRPRRKGAGGKSRSCRRASWSGPEVDEEERRKLAHSSRLSLVFAEADPQFARLRQRLNALALSRAPPKARGGARRRRGPAAIAPLPAAAHHGYDGAGTGGKAGVPFYAVRVGAEEHLYHTRSPSPGRRALSVDLHGLTREQALARLDATLPEWVEIAMGLDHPWVIPAVIVCGGGNQVLSEAVEGWIKCNKNVAKAPQKKFSRRRSI